MTTPSEGPAGWEQGNWVQATDWLTNLSADEQRNLQAVVGMSPEQRQSAVAFASLDDRQQGNLMRAANRDPLRTRIENATRAAVARVHLTYDNTRGRISEMATSLASQARDYRDVAVQGVRDARDTVVQGARDVRDGAVQTVRDARDTAVDTARGARDTVVQGARNTLDRAEELGQQALGTYEAGRDRVVDMAQRGQVRLDQAWQSGTERVGEMRDSVVGGARNARDTAVQGVRNARDTAVDTGRNAVAAGREAAGRAGRWFEGKFNNAMIKAEGAVASYNAGRHNPDLGASGLSAKDRVEMAQRFSAALNAPSMEARNEILQGLAQSSQVQVDTQRSAMAALSGVASPGAQSPQTPAATGQQTGDQGTQQQTGANAKPKETKIER
ncbi:hypothetical protein JOF29_001285 [Kribbella aluminosa]|uniref:Uncharacterized protein n=1 Tax=Kribbella aluminosa TaxID=416017 RepID=A0ABS4UEX6_9ACTN|nr:hypothetical protein [Kribbella aluminosa]MBP2350202.1 hypothetical protein [Kribbella aluminosa]